MFFQTSYHYLKKKKLVKKLLKKLQIKKNQKKKIKQNDNMSVSDDDSFDNFKFSDE